MKSFAKHLLHRFPCVTAFLLIVMLITTLVGCGSGSAGQTAADNAAADNKTESVAAATSDAAADSKAESVTAETSGPEKAESAVDDASTAEKAKSDATEDASDADKTESAVENASADVTAPKSVVAVSKSIAELWLLAGGTLSGTTEDAMELEGISEDTAVIGTLSRPNNEAILALSPDLVLLTEELSAQKELKVALDDIGIATILIQITSFEDYRACMEELTGLTGREDLYTQNAVQIGERIEAVREQAKETAEANAADQKTFLAMRVSATKNKVFKDDYFACEIFRDFGLTNIAEGNTNLDELNLEAIVAADPDYIFVIPQGKEDEAMESYRTQFESNPVWSELGAVKEDRLFVMPKDYFQYKPNAQWDLAYEYVRDLLQES